LTIVVAVIVASLFLYLRDAVADPASIKGVTKVRRNGGYLLLINYETREKEMDGLSFKVYCEFDKKDFVFKSASLSNIRRGRHKIKLPISNVTRKRYGSLRGYKVDLYRKGILVSTRRSY